MKKKNEREKFLKEVLRKWRS